MAISAKHKRLLLPRIGGMLAGALVFSIGCGLIANDRYNEYQYYAVEVVEKHLVLDNNQSRMMMVVREEKGPSALVKVDATSYANATPGQKMSLRMKRRDLYPDDTDHLVFDLITPLALFIGGILFIVSAIHTVDDWPWRFKNSGEHR